MEDVQRRLAAQVAELHLDERFSQTREVVNKRLADGRTQVTSAFNKVWADIEVMREAQRKRGEEARAAAAAASPPVTPGKGDEHKAPSGLSPSVASTSVLSKPDLQQAQASVQAASQRAGAYLSSWGAWAAEKRKQGWRGKGQGAVEVQGGDRELEERPPVTTVTELGRAEGGQSADASAMAKEKESDDQAAGSEEQR